MSQSYAHTDWPDSQPVPTPAWLTPEAIALMDERMSKPAEEVVEEKSSSDELMGGNTKNPHQENGPGLKDTVGKEKKKLIPVHTCSSVGALRSSKP